MGGGRGVPKKKSKKQNQLICDSDRGGSKNPKILRTSYMESPLQYPPSLPRSLARSGLHDLNSAETRNVAIVCNAVVDFYSDSWWFVVGRRQT